MRGTPEYNERPAGLTIEQEIAVLQLRTRLDALYLQRERLGGTRRGLLWLAALGLMGPLVSSFVGGRRRSVLLAEIGEIGVIVVFVAFLAIVAWLTRDYSQSRQLGREIDGHHQSLRSLGLIYCGRTGFGSPPSYFIWRGSGERWVPGRVSVESAVSNTSAASLGPEMSGGRAPVALDQAVTSLPEDRRDFARHVLESSVECTRDLKSLGGGRAVLRWALVLTLPLGIYWMLQDPQYYTVTRLFGELPFGILPMAWIASLVWLVVDERKVRALRLRRNAIQGQLNELGLASGSATSRNRMHSGCCRAGKVG